MITKGLDALRALSNPAPQTAATDQLLELAKTIREPATVTKVRPPDEASGDKLVATKLVDVFHDWAREHGLQPAPAPSARPPMPDVSFVIAPTVEKRAEPPNLRHTSASGGGEKPPGLKPGPTQNWSCKTCWFYDRPKCTLYNWPVDPDEVCASWEHGGQDRLRSRRNAA